MKRCVIGKLVVAGMLLMPALVGARTTVVNHWNMPGGSVTTVHSYGPYYGYHPAPCCYYGGVAAGVAAGLVIGAAVAPKPAVVYAPPAVVTYVPPTVIYTAPTVTYRYPP